jgi:hypothetical protein
MQITQKFIKTFGLYSIIINIKTLFLINFSMDWFVFRKNDNKRSPEWSSINS